MKNLPKKKREIEPKPETNPVKPDLPEIEPNPEPGPFPLTPETEPLPGPEIEPVKDNCI